VIDSPVVTRAAAVPFERFLAEHQVLVMRYLSAAVGPADADDVFQETFLAALRAWPTVTDDGRLDRWILRIASRKAIDHHRSAGRRPRPVERLPEGVVEPSEPQDDALWSAVAELPDAQREAVLYRFALDLTYAEVGALMDSTPQTARANVYQAMKKLRGVLR
jgi:RNA polymerase sigma factor (sigma-70 family)